MIELKLPWPPSVNHYWRHPSRGPLAGRHIISEKGRAYRAEVMARVLQARIQAQKPERLAVTIGAFPPDRRKRDLDNLLKSLLDALVHACVIADDGLIDRLSIERMEVSSPGYVFVTITTKEQ